MRSFRSATHCVLKERDGLLLQRSTNISLLKARNRDAGDDRIRLLRQSPAILRQHERPQFLLLRRFEDDVEQHGPGLTIIIRYICGFPHPVARPQPCSAQESGFAVSHVVAGQNHSAIAHPTFERQKVATIRDPALMPYPPRRIVDRKALSDQTVRLFVNFDYRASVEHALDPIVRDYFRLVVHLESVPMPDPEIELMIFRS